MHLGKILKTICAYSNNYMNRNYGFIFIGVEEENNLENSVKAIPKRPISGLEEGQLVIVVEPSMRLTEVSDKGAHATGLSKGGRYIRINRDTI